MLSGHTRYLKNAVSNLVTGGSSAIVAVVLPYFFVRLFSHVEFSLWVLILQLAAYVNYLNFGVQLAIGRFVSHALARGEQTHAEDILTSGLQILTVLCAVAMVVIALIAAVLPAVFTKIEPSQIGTARVMLLWIGGALTLGLPASAYLGAFIGMQRNDIPAAVSLVTKVGLALSLVLVARATRSLESVAVTYFIASVAGYVLQYAWFKFECRHWRLRLLANLPQTRRELIDYCLSLTVWSLAMLLTSGVGTTVVGVFDFKNVGAFGVAFNLMAFFVGLFNAVLSPLLQVFTKLYARAEVLKLKRLFEFADHSTAVLVLLAACWLIGISHPLFTLWLGPKVAAISIPVFIILTVGSTIRCTAAVYAIYLLATGQQRRIYLSPIAEGVTNFVASIVGAMFFGAMGAAFGMVTGAVVGVGAYYVFYIRRTMPADFSIRRHLQSNLVRPILYAAPLLGVVIVASLLQTGLYWSVPMMAAASIPALLPLWRGSKLMRAGMSASSLEST